MNLLPWIIMAVLALIVVLLSIIIFRWKMWEARFFQRVESVRHEEFLSAREMREKIADILTDAVVEWVKKKRAEMEKGEVQDEVEKKS